MKNRVLIIAASAMACSALAPATAQLRVTKRADLTQPVTLEPGQGAILVAFRRLDSMSSGKSGTLAFARYDVAARDLVFQPKSAKKDGDKTTYSIEVRSADKKLPVEYHLMPVSAGDYVLTGAAVGPERQILNTFCLGAPTFRVNAGEVVYFGDLTPYIFVKLANGEKTNAMAYSARADEAKQALAAQPGLISAFRTAELRNNATYICVGEVMLAYAVPGATALEAPALPAEAAAEVRDGPGSGSQAQP